MGTRSVVTFFDDKTPIVAIYQQYDGYYDGVGLNLAEFLLNLQVVNGVSPNAKIFETANGIGCLAAQYIAKFKTDVGNVYIIDVGATEDYNYHVRIDSNGQLIMTADSDYEDDPFVGTPKQFVDLYGSE